RGLYLDSGWASATPTSAFTLDSHDGDGGLTFAGTGGYASTTDPSGVAHPVLRTDQSFTVSAWVNLASQPTHNATAVAQNGTTLSAFFLQYNYTDTQTPAWK